MKVRNSKETGKKSHKIPQAPKTPKNNIRTILKKKKKAERSRCKSRDLRREQNAEQDYYQINIGQREPPNKFSKCTRYLLSPRMQAAQAARASSQFCGPCNPCQTMEL